MTQSPTAMRAPCKASLPAGFACGEQSAGLLVFIRALFKLLRRCSAIRRTAADGDAKSDQSMSEPAPSASTAICASSLILRTRNCSDFLSPSLAS